MAFFKKSTDFHGLTVASVTPFKNGSIDFPALKRVINFQIENKIDKIVIAGSTGEGFRLSPKEYESLLSESLNIAGDKTGIIAACSAASTEEALRIASSAKKIGAGALMCCVPFYSKPTGEGIYLHFKTISEETDLPVILYTVPSRTGTEIADETLIKLSFLPNIKALKDSGQDIERPLRLKGKAAEGFAFLCGDDPKALAYSAQGGKGLVSVAGNIFPGLLLKIQELCLEGNFLEALSIQENLFPFYEALFCNPNPIGVKYAAYLIGLCEKEIGLPLTEPGKENSEAIKNSLDAIRKKFSL